MSSKRRKIKAMLNNDATYADIFGRLSMLCMNCYEWINLPATIDERFLELTLMYKGYALYFHDEVLGDITLPCMFDGELDIYRTPTRRYPYSVTSDYFDVRTDIDSVFIFNNYLRKPTIMTIDLYARRLTNILRAIDVNINAQKTPVAMSTTIANRQSINEAYEQYDGNVPVILTDKSQGIDFKEAFQSISTEAPYVADKLWFMYQALWNDAMTALGIENSNTDKRERRTESEVNGSGGAIEMYRNSGLSIRKQACKEINRMFGQNIDVIFRSNMDTLINRAFNPSAAQELDGQEIEGYVESELEYDI